MVKPHGSNFKVITTNVLGVRKLRIITVQYSFTPFNILYLAIFFDLFLAEFKILFLLTAVPYYGEI